MSSRSLLTAVVISAAMFGLAACEPDGSSDAAPANTTASAAPSVTDTGKAEATDPAPDASSAEPTASDAADPSCDAPKLPAGHKIISPVKQPSGDTLSAKDTKPRCGVNDVEFEATGAAKAYHFASTVKAQLSPASGSAKTVSLTELSQHIGDCLNHAQKANLVCSSYGNYEVTVDASGKITAIKEIYHS